MEEKDLIKYNKELTNSKIKDYFKSKEGIAFTSASVISFVPYFVADPSIYPIIIINSCVIISNLIRNLKSKLDNNYQLYEAITNSDEYHEFKELYDIFISNIAIFLKNFNFNNTKELCLFLLQMLESSNLSVSKKEYHIFKYGKDILVDELGARIVTGKTVCRHTTSFYTDVLNKTGVTSCNLSVSMIKPNQINSKRINYNHMVNCILDNNEKYLFDSTSYNFFGTSKDKGLDDNYAISPIDNGICKIDQKRSIIINPKSEREYVSLSNYQLQSISPLEIIETSYYISEMYLRNYLMVEEFYNSTRNIIERLNYLINRLAPLSDNPIKEWKIK